MGNIKLGFLNETKKWGEISVLVKVLKRIGENFVFSKISHLPTFCEFNFN